MLVKNRGLKNELHCVFVDSEKASLRLCPGGRGLALYEKVGGSRDVCQKSAKYLRGQWCEVRSRTDGCFKGRHGNTPKSGLSHSSLRW